MDKILYTINGTQFTTGSALLEFSYLLAAIMFVVGLKLLSHPETARKGNRWAGAGMVLAMVTTLLLHKDNNGASIPLQNAILIVALIIAASIVGWVIAKKVKMTAMPQLVSLFNATGGAASALVALLEFPNVATSGVLVITLLGLFIGSVSFSGSLIAYGKLDGKVSDIRSSFMKYINMTLLLVIVVLIVLIILKGNDGTGAYAYALLGISLLYGVLFVMPIGGADMPVVISLLNSFTGIAAAMAGYIYDNQAMILGGILVGAAGTILTVLMCKAMNRSLLNVIIGDFGGGGGAAATDKEQGNIKEITLSDAGILLSYSQKVVIVPGYGLAVAQAQHVCSEMDNMLTEKGVEVKYAIHPVAGRMPGHMNVLLAEADVPYEKLIEMDNINPSLSSTDVIVIIGANDVVNPAALDDPSSPIYGMPIIMAHEAKNIIVMKRGMGKGYAGIENHLFFNEKTRMLFGNAKDSLQKLVNEIKEL